LLSATGNGTGGNVSVIGTNFCTARLVVGTVTGFTSLDVKLQSSPDNVTYTDITGATFTQVTAATKSQMIDFQLPTVATATASPPIYVRAVATLVGTSCQMSVTIFGMIDTSGTNAYSNAPPTIN